MQPLVRPPVDESEMRPSRRTIQGWQADTARRALLRAYVADRGPIARGDAVLCALYWLERHDAPSPEGIARSPESAVPPGGRPVAPGEIAVLYPTHRGRRLTGVPDFLRRLIERGLAYPAGGSCYRTTPLGEAVVHALPDMTAVAELCGVRTRRSHTAG